MNIKQKANKFRSIVNEMADLYEKKNSNYGDSFGQLFEELGPTAGLVPLWNKLHRATSLIKGNKNNCESLEDTLKDLACYAIMNLIEMEAQKDKGCCNVSALPEYVECDVYKMHRQQINCSFTAADCYGCKHASCPYFRSSLTITGNPDIGFGNPIKTAYGSTDPCEGCKTKELLQTGGTYVGDLPCQWCNKNPYKFYCGTTSTMTTENTNSGTSGSYTISLTTKGSNSNE